MKEKRIVAIGDSFFYLSSHLDETGYRLSKGLLSYLEDKLPGYKIINTGINGACTDTWLTAPIEKSDIYLIMLGTNDWWNCLALPIGTERDYLFRLKGTILGNLGCLVARIKALTPNPTIFLANPIERGDFVYINDPYNYAKGSYEPKNGRTLKQIADAIFTKCREAGVININTHDKSGISCFNAVKFKRCFLHGKVVDLPYPNYIQGLYDPEAGVYPYPREAEDMTFDGLHPSDKGAEKIAEVLAEAMKEVLKID
jgi:lysophospholipase L1-like esterase